LSIEQAKQGKGNDQEEMSEKIRAHQEELKSVPLQSQDTK